MKVFFFACLFVVLVPTDGINCDRKEVQFTRRCIANGDGCGLEDTRRCTRLENKLTERCDYECPEVSDMCGHMEEKFLRKCVNKGRGCGGKETNRCSKLEERLKSSMCDYICPGCTPRQIKDLDLSGLHGDWEFTAEIKTTEESATIIGRAFPTADVSDICGEWKDGGDDGQGKMLFLRGGRLSFDIGWKDLIQGPDLINDGEWHFVGIRFEDSEYIMTLDGDTDYKSFPHQPTGIADPPGWETYFGFNIGHNRGNQTPCGGDMAKAFVGHIRNVYYKGEPLDGFMYREPLFSSIR